MTTPVAGLQAALAAWVDDLKIRPARRTLVSYRIRERRRTLALAPSVADDPGAADALVRWLSSRGRDRSALRALLDRASRRIVTAAPGADAALPAIPGPIDLQARLDRLHAAWMPHLPKPRIRWARTTFKPTRSIRFGCYRKRDREIRIHPRLGLPWVADLFVDAVIHHELCHHRQACEPVRGERAHSARFRTWERAFPEWRASERWMRAHLPWLLDPESRPVAHNPHNTLPP
jgi:hypothetical protein